MPETIEIVARFEIHAVHVDLDDESEAHGASCGCRWCDPDDVRDRRAELEAGRPSRF